MKELLRSNDPVVISFVDALLKESGIVHSIADQHMSILDDRMHNAFSLWLSSNGRTTPTTGPP